MASERVVRIILTGDSAGLVRAMQVAGAESEKTRTKMERMQSVGGGMKSLGHSMITLAAPLVALGGYAVKTAASFQDSMTLIRTQAGASESEITSMSKAIIGLSPKVGEGPKALADALYPIESVGLRGARALEALKAASVGAQVSGASLTDTANAVAGAMKSQLKDVHSASDAMSIMNGIVGTGKMKLTDLLDAMTTGILPAASKMGLGMRDVGAELAAMTRQGIPAIDAATRLRMSLNQIAAPKAGAVKALAGIGLGQYQLAHDLRGPNGLVGAMTDLRAHLQGASQDAQATAISQIFGGAKSSSNVVAMLAALKDMTGIRKTLQGADSAKLMEAMGVRTKDATFKWAQLKATSQVALVGLGNALMPIVVKYLPKLVGFIKDATKWFEHLSPGVKKIIVGFTLFLAIGGPILIFLGSFIGAISVIGGALTVLMGPVGLIILGIAAVIAIGVLLITHWKQVKATADNVFRSIGFAVQQVGHFIGSVFSTLFNVMTWPFRETGRVIKGVLDGILSAVRSVVGLVTKVWNASPLGGEFGFVKNLLQGNASGAAHSLIHGMTFGLLHAGGPVRTHYDSGGPVGTDTVPAWLTPGEFVLNKTAAARVGMPALTAMNSGASLGGGGNITIESTPVIFKLDSRVLAEGVVRYTTKMAARGSHSLVGGSLMMGSTP